VPCIGGLKGAQDLHEPVSKVCGNSPRTRLVLLPIQFMKSLQKINLALRASNEARRMSRLKVYAPKDAQIPNIPPNSTILSNSVMPAEHYNHPTPQKTLNERCFLLHQGAPFPKLPPMHISLRVMCARSRRTTFTPPHYSVSTAVSARLRCMTPRNRRRSQTSSLTSTRALSKGKPSNSFKLLQRLASIISVTRRLMRVS